MLGVEIESKLPNLENEEDERDRKQEGTEQKTGTSFLEISTQMTLNCPPHPLDPILHIKIPLSRDIFSLQAHKVAKKTPVQARVMV